MLFNIYNYLNRPERSIYLEKIKAINNQKAVFLYSMTKYRPVTHFLEGIDVCLLPMRPHVSKSQIDLLSDGLSKYFNGN